MARKAPSAAEPTVQRAFALEGKLNPKALAQLLQRIQQSRTAAYLLVSDGTSERCCFFPVGALRLTSIGRRAGPGLEERVRAHASATSERLAALDDAIRHRKPLDEACAAAGLTEALRESSAAFARDELLDLCVWAGASFEYQEINPPPRFYNQKLQSVKLSLGVKPLVDEVEQALERWQKALGRRALPPRAPVARRSAPTSVPGVPHALADLLCDLAAEVPTFDDLIVAARKRGVDAVEAAVAAVALADAQVLEIGWRPAPREGVEAKVEARRDADWIEGALETLIHQLAARERLADAYDGMGEPKRALEHLRVVAKELEERQRYGDAIDALRRALKVAPRDFQLRHRIVGLLEGLGREAEAFDEGLVLARELKSVGLFNRARQMLRRLVGLRPDDAEVRRELVDLLVRMRETPDAIQELEGLADLYERRNQDRMALACRERILLLDPANDPARQALVRAVRHGAREALPWLGLAAGLLLALGVAAGLYTRVAVVRAFTAMHASVTERVAAKDYAGAREAISRFELAHGDSVTKEMRERVGVVERAESEREARARHDDGRRLELAGEMDAARKAYLDIVRRFAGTAAEPLAQERLREIERLEGEAGTLARRLIRQAERVQGAEGSIEAYAETVELARELVRRFGWSGVVARTRLPIRVESTPANAWVRVDDVPLDRTTPCTFERGIVPAFQVTIGLAGFEPVHRIVDLSAEGVMLPVRAQLQRQRQWRFPTLGPLRSAPLVADDVIVLGGADHRVYAVTQEGQRLWERPLGLFAEVDSAPTIAGGAVVVADRRGRLLVLDLRSGEPKWQRDHDGPIAVVGANAAGAAVVSRRDRLVAYRTRDAVALWESEVFAEGLAAPVTTNERERLAIVPTVDGRLSLLSLDSGRPALQVRLGARVTTPVTFCGPGYAMVTEDGQLRMLAPDGRRYLWVQTLPEPALAAPVSDGTTVWVGAGSRLLAFRADTGQALPLAHDRFDGALRASPVVAGGRVYVVTGQGTLYALAASTGALLWTYQTGGPILAPVRVHRDSVLVASTDFGLHAVQN